ncbi:hypothetical protein H072_3171 [Dactylellina haptotyla CBS 200.50]|uniref:F-box domain-containing protein n=1 Tax=Dactylellina haptotyla (strain CBS 200.50) TaxID=1284197 RepID=S8AIM4_DACHA|nr:hypothetical protein H072_3171 [Dactylellina haptotyla CBS 200.50]
MDNLPTELLGEIFSSLPLIDQISVGKVCRLWEAIIFSPTFLRSRYTSLVEKDVDAEVEHPYGIHRLFANTRHMVRCTVHQDGRISEFWIVSEDECGEGGGSETSHGSRVDITRGPTFLDEKFISPYVEYEANTTATKTNTNTGCNSAAAAAAARYGRRTRVEERMEEFRMIRKGKIQAMHFCKYEDPAEIRSVGFYPRWAGKEDVTNRELLQRIVEGRVQERVWIPEMGELEAGAYWVDFKGDSEYYLEEPSWFLQVWITMARG